MHKVSSLSVLLAVCAAVVQSIFASTPVKAQDPCQESVQPGGARYRICVPAAGWNGDLVIYAHGYVRDSSPLALPSEAGQIGAALQELGYAFATTSYRTNGLAVLPAQDDLLELVDIFWQQMEKPERVFLIGASEGGLITALAVERHPEVFAGGLAMCGPVGSFREQTAYFGDFRVVFDALFPGVLPGDPLNITVEMQQGWASLYGNRVLAAVTAPENRAKLLELFAVTGAPYDPARPETVAYTLRGVLGYNIFATNDARVKLGGQPYENAARVYTGSADDAALNAAVRRYPADPAAQAALELHETSGLLSVPLVTLHTSGDEIVPAWHVDRYRQKLESVGRGALHDHITIDRYGHCNFRPEEILQAFGRLVELVDQPPVITPAPTVTPSTPTPALTASQPAAKPTPFGTPAPVAEGSFLSRVWSRLVETLQALVQ